MKTKHTPGEWITEDCSNGGLIVCLGNPRDFNSQRIQIANEANAKLIAAAPELLEALNELLLWANIKDGSGSQYLRDKCQNAINKATK